MTSTDRTVSPPAPSRERAVRTAAWWGGVLTVVVLTVITGVLVYVYVQLAVVAEQWPPDGFEPPAAGPFLVAAIALGASAATVWFAGHAYGDGRRAPMVAGLVATVAAGGVAVLSIAGVVADEPGSPGDHAYGSLVVLLGWYLLVLLAAGAIALMVVAVRAGAGPHDVRLHVVVDVVRLLWWAVVAIGMVVLVTLGMGARL